MMAERNHHPAASARVVRDRRSPPRAYVRRVIVFASIQAVHIVRRNPMIRSWTLAAIGRAACSSIEAMAADPLPTETFKILPAALAVEAAEAAIASCKGQGYNVAVAIVDGDLRLLLVGEWTGALARALSRP